MNKTFVILILIRFISPLRQNLLYYNLLFLISRGKIKFWLVIIFILIKDSVLILLNIIGVFSRAWFYFHLMLIRWIKLQFLIMSMGSSDFSIRRIFGIILWNIFFCILLHGISYLIIWGEIVISVHIVMSHPIAILIWGSWTIRWLIKLLIWVNKILTIPSIIMNFSLTVIILWTYHLRILIPRIYSWVRILIWRHYNGSNLLSWSHRVRSHYYIRIYFLIINNFLSL